MRTTMLERPAVADGIASAGPAWRARRYRGRLIAAGVIVLLVIFAGFALLRVRALVSDLNGGKTELLAGAQILKGGTGLNKQQVEAATGHFKRAELDFDAASAQLNGRAFGIFGALPFASTQLGAARRLTDMGIHASRAGVVGGDALATALSEQPTSGSGVSGPGQKVMAIFQALDPKLATITSELDAMVADRTAIPSSGLVPPLAKAVSEFDSKVKVKTLRDAVAALKADERPLKSLLGLDGPRTYLVLQQDPAELRATGGFIGTVGFLSFDHGKMSPYQSLDVYDIDGADHYGKLLGPRGSPKHVDPPAPMEQTFRLISWQLRDSNWSPDFPSAARQAEFFLNLETGKKVDGVIAIDPYFISRILAVTGPVKVPQTGDTVTAQNFFDMSTLRVNVESGTGPGKQFLSYASQAIFARLLSTSPKEWLAMAQALQSACESRSLQAYFHDDQVTQFVQNHSCDGQVQHPNGDSLFVVLTNLNGTKDDYWMNRRSELSVKVLPNGIVRHSLTVHYDGLTPHPPLTGSWGYTGWLRIYVPPTATLISGTGVQFDTTKELGRRVFEGWLYVQFGASKDVTLVYDVPSNAIGATGGHFDLTWQKQAGRLGDPVKVSLDLPAGVELRRVAVSGKAIPTNTAVVSDLSSDREFSFVYGAG
ncbi:MAG TPA: DUF4012 domain-containing protein [Candidatus Dormibacteraeota bacterium]